MDFPVLRISLQRNPSLEQEVMEMIKHQVNQVIMQINHQVNLGEYSVYVLDHICFFQEKMSEFFQMMKHTNTKK
jgi:hypothetical protein